MPFVHKRTLGQRLAAVLDMSGGPSECWEFTGKWRVSLGYGLVSYKGKAWLVHRLAYFEHYGDIPDGEQVRHTCDNPPCANWSHLILGDRFQNMQDSIERGRNFQSNKTQCINGHDLTDENNLYHPPKRPNIRICRQCRKDNAPKYWRAQDKKRAAKRKQIKEMSDG